MTLDKSNQRFVDNYNANNYVTEAWMNTLFGNYTKAKSLLKKHYDIASKWDRISLKKVHQERVDKNKYENLKVGDLGFSSSSLKPYGKGTFNNKTYEVKSSENFIDEGKKIKIINILQDKILVKKSR